MDCAEWILMDFHALSREPDAQHEAVCSRHQLPAAHSTSESAIEGIHHLQINKEVCENLFAKKEKNGNLRTEGLSNRWTCFINDAILLVGKIPAYMPVPLQQSTQDRFDEGNRTSEQSRASPPDGPYDISIEWDDDW